MGPKPGAGDPDGVHAAWAREEELEQRHRGSWFGPLAPLLADLWSSRGLVRAGLSPRALASAEAGRLAGTEAWAWVEVLTVESGNARRRVNA